MTIELIETAADAPDALELIGELSRHLQAITGSSGANNFSMPSEDASFVVAYRDGRACGCGALRPLDPPGVPGACEFKRMYARAPHEGIGSLILMDLERRAAAMGYLEAWLETRRVNTVAVGFYKRHGYMERENYGVYVGRPEAVCFEKKLR